MATNYTFINEAGELIHNEDRVYTYDFGYKRAYGTLKRNEDYPEVSEYFINYDNGDQLAVLDTRTVYKA